MRDIDRLLPTEIEKLARDLPRLTVAAVEAITYGNAERLMQHTAGGR